ncbi:hypothetical protein C2U39_19900 [Aeromonas sp. ASNIH3]|nr:hypothetical protein C2U39_19900 [Aeromonas sp. ASNIH3]
MVILLLLWRAEGYHQSAVGHLSPFIHECRTYYLNSRSTQSFGCGLFCLATNQIAQTGLSSLPPVIYYSEQLFRNP